jgi:hypothetical protein
LDQTDLQRGFDRLGVMTGDAPTIDEALAAFLAAKGSAVKPAVFGN